MILAFIVIAYEIALVLRFAYLAYVKAPKEIRRLESIESVSESDVAKWRAYRDKCKMNFSIASAITVFSVVIFLS